MSKKNHVHRLKRHRYKNGEVIFFCVKDDCSFKVNADLTWGKTAECWRCFAPFSMTNESKRQDKPHCEGCTGFRTEESYNKYLKKKAEKEKTIIKVEPTQQDLRSRLDSLMNSTAGNPLPSEKYPDEDML